MGEQRVWMYSAMQMAYGRLLYAKGENVEALKQVENAYKLSARNDVDNTLLYIDLLMKNGRDQNALPLLDQLMKTGKGNPVIKEQLATLYAKFNPGKDGQAYVAQIEAGINAEIKADMMKHAVNKPAPAFEVTNSNGKKVTLANFIGKTIILDFWATWCGPCKKSFPAMQRAVNKYKNDPNVKFLFIHTWENSKDPLTDAKNYLAANNYNFDLYIDPKSGEKGNLSVAMFEVKGIPAKFVIDGKGNIRFQVSGFGNGDDAAVEELSLMIDHVKNNY